MSVHDTEAKIRLKHLLNQLVPDQRIGTPGGDLYSAIWEVANETADQAIERQGEVIMAAIRGDIRWDEGCEPVWFGEDGTVRS